MQKLIPIGIVVAVLLVATLICSNSIQGEHAQSNTTLALMSNLQMSKTQNTMATTIDHMANGYIWIAVVMGVVILAVVFLAIKIVSANRSRDAEGDYYEPTRQLPRVAGGMPKMLLLNRDPRPWFKQMGYQEKLALRARIWTFLSYLDAEIGDNGVYNDPGANIVVAQPDPRPGFFVRSLKLPTRSKQPAMKKNNSEIDIFWG